MCEGPLFEGAPPVPARQHKRPFLFQYFILCLICAHMSRCGVPHTLPTPSQVLYANTRIAILAGACEPVCKESSNCYWPERCQTAVRGLHKSAKSPYKQYSWYYKSGADACDTKPDCSTCKDKDCRAPSLSMGKSIWSHLH